MDNKLEIVDDKVVRKTSIRECGQDIEVCEVVIDKETFVKCYKKWIENKET